jgi:low affinity Fe/Cu permease
VPEQQPQPQREKVPPFIMAKEEAREQRGVRVWFADFSGNAASLVGSPAAFLAAIGIVALWACLGPYFHYSDTWQLVINTGSSIVTFLMVFVIQNTQNRDAKAIHLKLNELIHAGKHAQNDLIDIEKLSDEELKKLDEHYTRIRHEFERRRRHGDNAA